jgi:hypothetical protein
VRRKPSSLSIHLAGKDFFTAEEAAVYCGISLKRWRKDVEPNIQPGRFMGQTIYSREDLKDYIQRTGEGKKGVPWEPNWAGLDALPARRKSAKTDDSAPSKRK